MLLYEKRREVLSVGKRESCWNASKTDNEVFVSLRALSIWISYFLNDTADVCVSHAHTLYMSRIKAAR